MSAHTSRCGAPTHSIKSDGPSSSPTSAAIQTSSAREPRASSTRRPSRFDPDPPASNFKRRAGIFQSAFSIATKPVYKSEIDDAAEDGAASRATQTKDLFAAGNCAESGRIEEIASAALFCLQLVYALDTHRIDRCLLSSLNFAEIEGLPHTRTGGV
jgi:hypothetical protein